MEVIDQIHISKQLVESFALLTGDYNPIHLDSEYASNSRFGKPIAHGMLLSSFFSKIIASNYPGVGSIYLSQDIKFIKPCYVGDTIKVVIKLLNKTQKSKAYIYTLLTQIYDSNDQLLIDGTAEVLHDI
jgi:3-hydroxybutyryl-CoA dehydratase